MGERAITFALGEYYHIYNRGADKRVIYTDPADYRRFIELLYLCNTTNAIVIRDIYRDFRSIYEYDRGEPIVAIGAFCLMPNHFHILATPLVDDGISIFMGKLGTSHAMFFNKKHERRGALFEGKFKAQHADSDEYLKYLYSYIHLNPVKLIQSDWKEKGIRDVLGGYAYASEYPYSSLQLYLQGDNTGTILPQYFPEYFLNLADQKEELMEWLQYNALTE